MCRESRIESVCVVGLGTVGLPAARHFLESGVETWGVDMSSSARERASRFLPAYDTISRSPTADCYVLCVYAGITPPRAERFMWASDPGTPDMSSLLLVCRKLLTKKPALVVVESTVVPGTCRRLAREARRLGTGVAHVPHRLWPERPEKYGVKQQRVVGAGDARAMWLATDLYARCDIPLFECESLEEAEICKVAENAHRFVQISFAEELARVAVSLGVEFDHLREAINTKWNTGVLEVRDGIGGTCLPKYIRFMTGVAPDAALLQGAIRADKQYRTRRREARVTGAGSVASAAELAPTAT
jgi:nucleotide sugar dehydrogenase